MKKLTKPQRIALKAIRDHEVTYHRNSLFANDGHRVRIDGKIQAIGRSFKYGTLVALQRRELVEMDRGGVRITDAGRKLA
jgi:hypothetical protein